jgi:hypothetical protein
MSASYAAIEMDRLKVDIRQIGKNFSAQLPACGLLLILAGKRLA